MGKRQEGTGKGQGARGKGQGARGKRQGARGEGQEARGWVSVRILRMVASRSGDEETAKADGADGGLNEAFVLADSADWGWFCGSLAL